MNIYTPYTYLITFLPTGQQYYGVRTKQGCHPTDLWNSYYTSSKTVRQLIKQHGADAFRWEVRKTFSNREDAIIWEHRLLSRIDAARNPQYLNKNNGDRKFFGGGVPKGFRHSEDARRKMSINSSGSNNPNYGRNFSEATRRKLSEARKGKCNLTAEQVEKLKERMTGENNFNYGKKFAWWNNGTHNKLVEQCPGDKWVRGRLWKAGHREKMLASRHPKKEGTLVE